MPVSTSWRGSLRRSSMYARTARRGTRAGCAPSSSAGAADGAGARCRRPGPSCSLEQLVVALGDAEQVGDDEHGERLAVLADELARRRRSTNSSIWRSASRHMNSSFSRRRFGVIRRISSPRCAVCTGGSKVRIWSLIGSSSRCCSMSSLTSSPSSGTGKPGNGPVGELHDENESVSLYTAIASS